jgi:phage FluMu protein Com
MTEVRCTVMRFVNGQVRQCNQKLGENLRGSIMIKCNRCKNVVEFTSIDSKSPVMI